MSCWAYRREGRIGGQIGGTRPTLKVGNRTFDALWAIDGAIDPDWRGRGVLSALLGAVGEERDVAMATEVHPAGVRAMLNCGWKLLGTLGLYVRPIDVASLLRARGRSVAATLLGTPANAALRAIERVLRPALSLEEIDRFDDRVDRVWKEASTFYPVACCRDLGFLDWRFGRYPGTRYRFFHLHREATVVGYAVVRFGRRGGLPAAYLVDFFCAPRWIPALLALFLDLARGEGAATACCLHRNPVSTSGFAALGFVRRETGWPLLVRPRALPPREETLATRPASWFITAADSDLDRPRPAEEERA